MDVRRSCMYRELTYEPSDLVGIVITSGVLSCALLTELEERVGISSTSPHHLFGTKSTCLG